MALPPVSFLAEIVAGTTRITRRNPQIVDRPGGMDAWIIHLTVSGRGTIGRGAGAFSALPGDLLLWPPRVPHDYTASPPEGAWIHHWAYVQPRPHWFPWLAWPVAAGGVLRLRCGESLPAINQAFAAVVSAWERGGSHRAALAMARLELLLIAIDALNPLSCPALDPRIQAILDHLERRYDQPVSVAGLAARAGLSPSRFAHRFRAEVGLAPQAWLERRRVAAACALLRASGMAISAVAAQVGYHDPAYFSRVFRRRTGRSPAHWRRSGV